jgi:hypothetical protein
MKELYKSVSILCHSNYAAERLARKLSNKWSTMRDLQASGDRLTVMTDPHVSRYIKKQPEMRQMTELFSVSVSQ